MLTLTIAILSILTSLVLGFIAGRTTAPKRPIRSPLERRLRPRLSDDELNLLSEQYRSQAHGKSKRSFFKPKPFTRTPDAHSASQGAFPK